MQVALRAIDKRRISHAGGDREQEKVDEKDRESGRVYEEEDEGKSKWEKCTR